MTSDFKTHFSYFLSGLHLYFQQKANFDWFQWVHHISQRFWQKLSKTFRQMRTVLYCRSFPISISFHFFTQQFYAIFNFVYHIYKKNICLFLNQNFCDTMYSEIHLHNNFKTIDLHISLFIKTDNKIFIVNFPMLAVLLLAV